MSKTIRLTGMSARSIEDALSTVLGRAAETIADIRRFDVVSLGGTVTDSGVVDEYEVVVDITFGVRESVHG